MNNIVVLIDFNNYFNRFYFSDKNSCVERYLRFVKEILNYFSPEFMINLFDAPFSFRKEKYAFYKANRENKPKEFYDLLKECKFNLQKFNYHCMTSKSLEAEDLMNMIIKNTEIEEYKYIILSGDKDVLQLENKNVKIFDYRKEKNELFSNRKCEFESKEEFLLFLALKGDASDNIPGVKGLGDKKAKNIVEKYKTYENLKSELSIFNLLKAKSSDKDISKIQENEDDFDKSYELVKLYNNVYKIDMEKYRVIY